MSKFKDYGTIFIVLLLFVFLGPPVAYNILGFTWDLGNTESEVMTIPTSPPTHYNLSKDLLSIEELKPRQHIYGLKENATVDFGIKNEKNIPYNFSVLWYHNNTRHFGWTNSSNMTSTFYSWYPVPQKGEWKIQVVLKWEYLNQRKSN